MKLHTSSLCDLPGNRRDVTRTIALVPDDRIGYYHYSSASWGKNFPEANGRQQSPVNIISGKALYHKQLSPLEVRYPIFREADVINNGRVLVIRPRYKKDVINKEEIKGVMKGVPFYNGHEFELGEIHFHWGKDNDRGSEHTINSKSYPMEVQFVHHNNKYSSVEEANEKKDGIVISSIFVMVSRENTALQSVLGLFSEIKFKDEFVTMSSHFNPESLLPHEQLRDYWSYQGSLTYPPCTESVTWVVYRYPITISQNQIESFRRLRSHTKNNPPSIPLDDGFLADNFRQTQNLNDRFVYSSFES